MTGPGQTLPVERFDQTQLGAPPVAGFDLRWLSSVLPANCGLAGGLIGQPSASDFPDEESIILNAAPKRRAEFRAGRSYAREALALVGCPRSNIPKDRHGAPIWPPGYRGSISHTDSLAIAVAAPDAYFRGLGLDIETVTPVDKDLGPFIFRPGELQEIPNWEGCDVDPSKCIFSAKEAFIKLYYSIDGVLLDFLEVSISFDNSLTEYSAYTSNPAAMANSMGSKAARGRLAWNDQAVAAIMYVHRNDELQ